MNQSVPGSGVSEADGAAHPSRPRPMSIDALKYLIANATSGDVSFEGMGEVHGTLLVERDVSLSIRGTTLVGRGGPAITVGSGSKLKLKDGHLTTTARDPHAVANGSVGDWRAGTAIRVDPGGGVSLMDVDLMGDVSGDCPLAGEWHLPSSWAIQDLPARTRTVLSIRGYVPHQVDVASDIHNVESTHPSLGPGPVEFSVDVDARDFEAGALLDGWIRFRGGGAVRRLRLRARLVAAVGRPALPPPLWEARAFSSPPKAPSASGSPDARPSGEGRVAAQQPGGLSGVFSRVAPAPAAGKSAQPSAPPWPQPNVERLSPSPGTQPPVSSPPTAHGGARALSPVFGKPPVKPESVADQAKDASSSAAPSDQPSAVQGSPDERAPDQRPAPDPAPPAGMNRGVISAVFRRPGGGSPPPTS